jgi:hypothetical protein
MMPDPHVKAAIDRGFLQYQTYTNLINPLTSRDRAEITLNTLIYYLFAKCFVLIKQSYNTISCFFLFTRY